MRVRMNRLYSHSPDGIHVDHYLPGQKYDLPDVFAQNLLATGVAIEDKDMMAAPEIKEVAPQVKAKKRRK